jgi:hypothetical protein
MRPLAAVVGIPVAITVDAELAGFRDPAACVHVRLALPNGTILVCGAA